MIKAMRVLTAEGHPNADRLRVYTLTDVAQDEDVTDENTIQVCANLTNVYSVGHIVGVCQIGHDCGDFKIKSRKVRGVLSQGMMLSIVAAVPGADVSAQYADFEY